MNHRKQTPTTRKGNQMTTTYADYVAHFNATTADAVNGVFPMTEAHWLAANYPAWRHRYSNEDFDRAQGLATQMTNADRAAGLPAPAYGCGETNWKLAEAAVKAAQR